MKFRILVVDDHPVFRHGLVSLIESDPRYSVSGQAGSLPEALARLEAEVPDLALVDLSLGAEGTGIDLIERLRDRFPSVRTLVVSIHSEAVYADRLRAAGAHGFVPKRAPGPVLREAIQAVLSGKTVFSPPEAPGGDSQGPDPSRSLSPREQEIFELVGKGLGVREIAGRLGLSVKTVGVHQEHIKARLGTATSSELRRLAIEWQASR